MKIIDVRGDALAALAGRGIPSCWRVRMRLEGRTFDPIICAYSVKEAEAKARALTAGIANPAMPWTLRWPDRKPSLRWRIAEPELVAVERLHPDSIHARPAAFRLSPRGRGQAGDRSVAAPSTASIRTPPTPPRKRRS